jgi:protein arginine N-methyltransferase 1
MFAEPARAFAHCEALRRVITPTTTVVDLGSGPGFFALIAARLGARQVYAIERDDVIEVGRDLARENGLSLRITFIHDDVSAVTLAEPCDVLISDLRGALPLYKRHLPTVIAARRRLIAPGGRVIAEKDRLVVAVVTAPDAYRRMVDPWRLRPEGLDFTPGLAFASNIPCFERIPADAMLTSAAVWAELDYRTMEHASVAGLVSLTTTRAGEAHGLLIWFDAVVWGDLGFSSGPGSPVRLYSPLFLPWPEPVALAADDNVNVVLRADFVGDDYVWSWHTRTTGGSHFKQSSFHGGPIARETLTALAPSYVPALSREGEVIRFVLTAIDGQTPLQDIARRVAAKFSDQLGDERDARNKTLELAREYRRSSR